MNILSHVCDTAIFMDSNHLSAFQKGSPFERISKKRRGGKKKCEIVEQEGRVGVEVDF